MITVSIFINGSPVFTRTAVRTHGKDDNNCCEYSVDDGRIISHKPKDGVVVLASKIIKGIQEQLPKEITNV